ncbi:MAG: flagellar biosynthesis anti-sigma factor FlgM [Selenomonadaceae bacterium]|nr:flagellar biosynthesis anti-sigma factor FlgM [Selenomonadaceae bacterium]MBQ6131027.1 flagellar biosynthesis anti-sigma factor FlgM [Selenomonadaceae bacterium]
MIINNVNSSANYYSNVAATRYANPTSYVRGVQKNDAFTPSREAQSFSDLLNKLKGTSEVREDKVSEIQQKISSGQYFVSAQDIAASLLTNRF